MKKALLVTALTLALATASTATMFASDGERGMWVDFYGDQTPEAGIGLAKYLAGGLWGEARLNALGTDRVTAGVDVMYVVPKKVLLFLEMYGGVGLDFRLKTQELGGHVTLGSSFWWFFTEAEYRLVDRGTVLRGGFRLRF